MNSYASPPGSLDPLAGSVSALALRTVRSPPRLSQTSGNETISGLSSATACSIRRFAWAMLAALSAPGFICTTVTRIRTSPAMGRWRERSLSAVLWQGGALARRGAGRAPHVSSAPGLAVRSVAAGSASRWAWRHPMRRGGHVKLLETGRYLEQRSRLVGIGDRHGLQFTVAIRIGAFGAQQHTVTSQTDLSFAIVDNGVIGRARDASDRIGPGLPE